MITMPTSELTGLIADVLAFADPAKDGLFHGVLLEWSEDDYTLYASGYDVLSGGRTSWSPGEGREGEIDAEGDESIDVDSFGGGDSSWRVFIRYEDAKEIVKVFKLPAKRWWVPVAIKVNDTGTRLTIERTGDHGPTEALLSARTEAVALAQFPIIEDTATFTEGVAQSPASAIVFNAARLASFGSVRAHGDLVLTFGREGDPVSARMGSRFVGFIHLAGANRSAARTSDVLRNGSGLVATATALDEIGDGPIVRQQVSQ